MSPWSVSSQTITFTLVVTLCPKTRHFVYNYYDFVTKPLAVMYL